jgi:hypothetical protein
MGVNKALSSANITKFLVFSNTAGQTDIRLLLTEMNYEESVFDVSVRMSVTVVDAAALPNFAPITSTFDDLKLAGGEKVEVGFTDNYGNEYELEMYIETLDELGNTTKTQTYRINMVSMEYLMNESKRVRKKYEQKISDNIPKILQEVLGTSKDIFVDETINNFSFLGVNKKPFYWCISLAKKSVPFKQGQVAGYLFFENYNGYHFKAIDELFAQAPKFSCIYNETTDKLPGGYDAKIIDFTFDTNINFQNELKLGTYNTERFDFNPYDQMYKENPFTYEEQEGAIVPVAKTRITERINPIFIENPSKFLDYPQDIGTLPPGSNLEEQLKKSKEPNLELDDILSQSSMRYQQATTIQVTITIAANLSLNVGDIIFADIPEVSATLKPKPENTNSGLYMISELCHKLTPRRSATKLVLIRDSYDR